MKNLTYESLRIQNYFTRTDITIEEKKTIFKYRTRMADFGENYKGGRGQVSCPLCGTHPDKQELSYECRYIKEKLNLNGSFSEIYGENIEKQTVETLEKITQIRENIKNLPSQAHVSLGSNPSAAQDPVYQSVNLSLVNLD